MRVFVLAIGFTPYSLQLADGLSHLHRVSLLVEQRQVRPYLAELPRFFAETGFKLLTMNHYPFPDPRKIWTLGRIMGQVMACRPDVLHVQVGPIYSEATWAVGLLAKTGLPVVATVHDVTLHPGDGITPRSLKTVFALREAADRLIVHGRGMAAELAEDYGYPAEEIDIVPHGNYNIYCHDLPPREEIQPRPGRVLLFGRMIYYKGLEVLYRAAPLVAERVPEVEFVIAGRGPELDRLADRLAQSPHFKVLGGYLPDSQVGRLFKESTLAVAPYLEASMSGPVSIALSLGTPLVATRVGAFPETLEDGRDALLVEPNDPAQLAEAIVRVLTEPELADRLARNGLDLANGELDWPGKVARLTTESYRRAIEQRRAGRRPPRPGRAERWRRLNSRRQGWVDV